MTMRFMMIVKATQDSGSGVMPDEQILAARGTWPDCGF
jgi:hypothetical protein